MVDTVLAQIEQRIDSAKEGATPQNLNETVETIVEQQMSLKKRAGR